jgi:hypothetical protein
MTCYVDDMYLDPMGEFGRMKMSHLIANTDEELHAMAARIGVARRWWQDPATKRGCSHSHYDIALSKRALAVAAGAVEITQRQGVAIQGLKRFGLPPGDLATVVERYHAEKVERRQRALDLDRQLAKE